MGIATGNTTPSGTYTITVSATNGVITKTTSFTLIVLAPQGQSAKFQIGDRVEVTGGLAVRVSPTTFSTRLGVKPAKSQGTIIGGSTYSDGYWWWKIDYDTPPDGWSVEDRLVKI